MAERVVVGLEAVEIEEEQERRFIAGRREVLVEAADECAAVPETRQGVAERFDTRQLKQHQVLLEREHETPDDGDEAERSRDQRNRLHPMKVVPELDPEADQRHRDRGEDDRHAVEPAALSPGRGHERSGGDENEPGGPAEVEPAAVLVGAVRDLDQIDGVGHREQDETAAHHEPHPVQLPARQPERTENQGEQQGVSGRVGEVGRDGCEAAGRRSPHGAKHETRGERANGESGDQTVHPDEAAEIDDGRTDEEPEADEDRNVEAEVAEIGERRERLRCEVLQRERVVDVSERPREDSGSDPDPGSSTAPAQALAADTSRRRAGRRRHRRSS